MQASSSTSNEHVALDVAIDMEEEEFYQMTAPSFKIQERLEPSRFISPVPSLACAVCADIVDRPVQPPCCLLLLCASCVYAHHQEHDTYTLQPTTWPFTIQSTTPTDNPGTERATIALCPVQQEGACACSVKPPRPTYSTATLQALNHHAHCVMVENLQGFQADGSRLSRAKDVVHSNASYPDASDTGTSLYRAPSA